MADVAKSPKLRERPLSPHLQVYKMAPTMAMSIIHRITGAGLYFGTILVVWWLIALASGPQSYELFSAVATSWLGYLVLVGFTWALFHHMLGGIRHFMWDVGRGLEKTFATKLAWATIIGSIFLTALTWAIVISFS